MIKDLLISFKDNIKAKSSNPLFGTLILVWLTKNWNLFYTIFNFDSNTTLDKKREFIVSHFTKIPFLETLLWCVFEAFIVILISYLLLNLARLIINFYEKKITPLVYKWTDEKSIVLKSVYDISENERKRLEKKVEEERDAKLKLQEDYDKLEKRFAELLTTKNEINVVEKGSENSKSKKEKSTPTLTTTQKNEKSTLLLNLLKRENKIAAFESIASSVLNGIPLEKSNLQVQEFATLGLITPGVHQGSGNFNYSLTQVGSELHNLIMFEKMK